MPHSFFLRWLYEHVESGHHLCLWSPRSGATFSEIGATLAALDSPESPVSKRMKRCAKEDLYFGVGLLGAVPGSGRGTAADVSVVPGTWADVDVLDPAHRKPNLPKDDRAAMNLLRSVGVNPSVIVHTGHGLHGYWLFKEPWVIADEAARVECAAFLRRFGATMKAHAKKMGVDVDSVHDLARVLRLPGTTNHKGEPVPVRIVQPFSTLDDPVRYDPSDLEDTFVADETVGNAAERYAWADSVGALRLDPQAEPPQDKLNALLEIDLRIRRTWEHRRPDLQDQSPSSYDMSLANYAAKAGWMDQEIADLLIARRRKQGEPLKMRQRYYQITIGNALASQKNLEAISEMAAEAPTAPPSEPLTPDARAEKLRKISEVVGVKIARWIKEGKEESLYTMVLHDGAEVLMGRVDTVLSASKFRAKLYDSLQYYMPKGVDREWQSVVRALTEVVEVTEKEGRYEDISHWLSDYLSASVVRRDKGNGSMWQAALPGSEPFARNGRMHVATSHLRQHIQFHSRDNVSRDTLCNQLRMVGFKPGSITGVTEDKRTVCRYYWAIDEALLAEIVGTTRGNGEQANDEE